MYIDTSFYDQLNRQLGAGPGDFARYYVIAHEYGHHVQTLTGLANQIRSLQSQDPRRANQLQVMMELQADCYAGVWAHSANQRGKLEGGDVQEGLGAASAVGDDRIQQKTQGRVNAESFTHGSAQQRSQWFMRGFENGNPNSCDTFQ
jgi:predicted metalloprotease